MGSKAQIISTIAAAATVLLAVIGLYVEQRRDFGTALAGEREARRQRDAGFHQEISDARDYFANILIEIDRDGDKRVYKLEERMLKHAERLHLRMDRQEKRHMRMLNEVLENRERLLRLEAGDEEWQR